MKYLITFIFLLSFCYGQNHHLNLCHKAILEGGTYVDLENSLEATYKGTHHKTIYGIVVFETTKPIKKFLTEGTEVDQIIHNGTVYRVIATNMAVKRRELESEPYHYLISLKYIPNKKS